MSTTPGRSAWPTAPGVSAWSTTATVGAWPAMPGVAVWSTTATAAAWPAMPGVAVWPTTALSTQPGALGLASRPSGPRRVGSATSQPRRRPWTRGRDASGSRPELLPVLAREQRGAWSAGDDQPRQERPAADDDDLTRQRPERDTEDADFDRLDEAVGEAIGSDLDAFPDEHLTRRLDRLQRPIARLTAERARLTAELERRRVAAADEPAARQAARRDLRRQLAQRANSTPAATKRDADAGRIAEQHPRTGASFADGDLSAEHVRLIGETLSAVEPDRRDEIEARLLALAQRTNPTQFGTHARDLLAREAPSASDRAALHQHRRRRVRTYDTPDGGFAFSGLLYGDMAETARVALDAFRRPDTPDEHRSPEQRSADAFEQLCAASLRVGEAPTRHGVRPHVIISMTVDELTLGDRGVARFGSGQPATLRQLRTLLADCTWSRVVLGPDSTPIEASTTVRTVPAGLWRALVTRDGGCTWPGCDAPPNWCDVAHGAVAFSDDGQLSPGNAALLCRRHHRRFDLGAWRIVIEGDRVGYHREQEDLERAPSALPSAAGEDARGGAGPAWSKPPPDAREPRARGRPGDRTGQESQTEGASPPGGAAAARDDGKQIVLPLPPPMDDP